MAALLNVFTIFCVFAPAAPRACPSLFRRSGRAAEAPGEALRFVRMLGSVTRREVGTVLAAKRRGILRHCLFGRYRAEAGARVASQLRRKAGHAGLRGVPSFRRRKNGPATAFCLRAPSGCRHPRRARPPRLQTFMRVWAARGARPRAAPQPRATAAGSPPLSISGEMGREKKDGKKR